MLDRKEIHSTVYPLTESLKGSGPMQILKYEAKKDQIRSKYQMENALSKMKHLGPGKTWVSNLEPQKGLVLKLWPAA